jgi:DNA-binding transcriptional LysR family regulator
MDLKQLRHFVAAAETGNFSKASERTFVSQPALSASIGKLEAELGALLFARNKRGVTLTREGKRLLETARHVLSECARVKNDLNKLKSREIVRVGLIDTIAVELFAKLLKQFRDECPDVLLDIIDGSPLELARLDAEGRLDIAFTAQPSEKADPPGDDRCVLFSEPYVLMIPAGHHLAGRRSASVADLNGEALVARTHCEYRDGVNALFKALGIKPRLAFRTSQDERALALVRSGLGVALVPRHYKAEGTINLPFADAQFSRTVSLKWYAKAGMPAVERFAAFAKAAAWP